MSSSTRSVPSHPHEVTRVHERLLAAAGLSDSMVRTVDGAAVHIVEKGAGPPVVFIHGSGSPGLFWLPLLEQLEGMRAIVVDRPGFGLSDPVPVARTPSETAVGWIDRLLNALKLPAPILVGHSMGGLWSLRFALARPERVTALAMLGTPSLPGSHAPLPFRLMGTPGVRALIARQRETPKSFRQFAAMMGEGSTIAAHPSLVDLMVAVGNDPIAGDALRQEIRPLISPWALVSRTGFRRTARTSEAELQTVTVPTLLVGGEHDPVGGSNVARRVQTLIPRAELRLVDGGHAPWLGQTSQVAAVLSEWVARISSHHDAP